MKYNNDYKNHGKFWTKDEINVLKKHFQILPIEKIMKMLPGRTKTAIMGEAYNVLKLHSPCISKHFKGDYFKSPYKSLSKSDRAYIAGIFDGEGSISIYFKKFHVRLFIVNTNFDLINWLHKKLPHSFISTINPRKPNHKIRYTLYLLGSIYTVHLLKLMQPFLIVKKKRATVIIKLFDNLAKGISWREQINKDSITIPK